MLSLNSVFSIDAVAQPEARLISDVSEDDVKSELGLVLYLVDPDRFVDVNDFANLRWAQASRCHP